MRPRVNFLAVYVGMESLAITLIESGSICLSSESSSVCLSRESSDNFLSRESGKGTMSIESDKVIVFSSSEGWLRWY